LFEQNGRISYSLELPQYNKLRKTHRAAPLILVILRLPLDPAQWLTHTPESLIARRCAFWVSLRGAPDSTNETAQTVYIPTTNVLSVDGLTALMTKVSRREELNYER
jgi:hypothetical protein